MALPVSARPGTTGVRRFTAVREGSGSVATGTGEVVGWRVVGTGTGPDLPGMRNRARSSWALPGAQVVGGSAGCGSSGTGSASGMLAVAAIGGGVEASKRLRNSAAVIACACSEGGFGFDMRLGSQSGAKAGRNHPDSAETPTKPLLRIGSTGSPEPEARQQFAHKRAE